MYPTHSVLCLLPHLSSHLFHIRPIRDQFTFHFGMWGEFQPLRCSFILFRFTESLFSEKELSFTSKQGSLWLHFQVRALLHLINWWNVNLQMQRAAGCWEGAAVCSPRKPLNFHSSSISIRSMSHCVLFELSVGLLLSFSSGNYLSLNALNWIKSKIAKVEFKVVGSPSKLQVKT